jgi:AcrR family transcriptional regulator
MFDSPAPFAPASGRRREDHKNRTRAALVDSALELFSENGYDGTTTGEISRRAGVAPRTFFRYFDSKEHVLFFGLRDYLGELGSGFAGQPAGAGDLKALYDSVLALAPRLAAARPRYQQYRKAVESSATLRGRHLGYVRELRTSIASGVAHRRGLAAPDFGCRLVASLATTLVEETIDEWMSAPDDLDLAVAFGSAHQALQKLVRSVEAEGPPAPSRRTRPWAKQRFTSRNREEAAP